MVTWLLVPLTFLFPMLDSTRPPYVDLAHTISEFAYWFAQSGGKFGLPLLGLLMVVFLVTRRGIGTRRKWIEAGVVTLIATVFTAGGSSINEHIVKVELEVPRPNIIWLAGLEGTGPLGMTAQSFYDSGDKAARSAVLEKILRQEPAPVSLSRTIEDHWIQETGYSFPSGHSFSAMFIATFFLLTAATYLTTRRIWFFYALLPWALAVCYSRPILRVHTPTDITVGSLEGLVLGVIAWALARATIRQFA